MKISQLKKRVYRFIYLLPPLSPADIISAPQNLPRFLDSICQKAKLTRDKGPVVRVAGPRANVDDVERLVEERQERGKLRKRKRVFEMQGVGWEGARRG